MKSTLWRIVSAVVIGLAFTGLASAEVIRVCVSSTDVRTIVEAVGGDLVEVTGFVKGPDDPHTVEPTRRMVEALARADLMVVVGNALEEAWLPAMLAQAGNPALAEGGDRYLDLSDNLRTIAGPEGRGVPGSFHPEDNPHFLCDAVEGVKAAGAIAAKLAALVPAQAERFDANYRRFAREVMTEMVGEPLAALHGPEDFEPLAIAIERNELADFLARHGESDVPLGGQLAAFEPFRDTPLVGDHDTWPYFARRYGVRVLGYLEPEPGVPPTAPHLRQLIAKMQDRGVRIILTVQYFDPRHAQFVADATGAAIVPMAHNPQSRPGTDTYLDYIRYNSRTLLAALEAAATPETP